MRHLMAAAALLLALGPAEAQDYPTKPITIIVPAAAGGPTDTISRITAQAMSKLLGQTVTIENVGGAGGTIGTTRAVRAEPDGYTLLIYHVGLATAATLYRQLPYDTRQAFTSIGLVTDAPMTIIARNDYEPSTLKALVDHLKKPGVKASMGNAGVGSASHLCGMLFLSETKVQVTTVPYRGTAPVMNDLIGKQIDLSCDQATNTTGPILGKQVKGYAVTTKARLKSLPDLPTADEAGSEGLRAWGVARPVCAEGIAAGHRGEAFNRASDRAQGPRPGEALQRHQHRAHAGFQGDARGRSAHAAERDRPLGADHQGLRPICGLASARKLRAGYMSRRRVRR